MSKVMVLLNSMIEAQAFCQGIEYAEANTVSVIDTSRCKQGVVILEDSLAGTPHIRDLREKSDDQPNQTRNFFFFLNDDEDEFVIVDVEELQQMGWPVTSKDNDFNLIGPLQGYTPGDEDKPTPLVIFDRAFDQFIQYDVTQRESTVYTIPEITEI